MTCPIKITSKIIKEALAKKHSDDIFVTECKTGPSHYGCLILDAWVTNKSWANAKTIGYEIKVDRGDFLNDEKWRGYLDYCNEFYFVCPNKLIDKKELPPEVGLMYISSTGTRIYTKKKSVYRDLVIPEDLYRYLLMNRVQILNGDRQYIPKGREYWLNWLDEKTQDKYFGHHLSYKFREIIEKTVGEVKKENSHLKNKIKKAELVESILKEHGIDLTYFRSWDIKSEVGKLIGNIPPEFDRNLFNVIQEATEVLKQIELIRRKKDGC